MGLFHKALPTAKGWVVAYRRPMFKNQWLVAQEGFDTLESAHKMAQKLNHQQRIKDRQAQQMADLEQGRRTGQVPTARGFYFDNEG